jgi:diketogulonate reductase-like aldo/keto reductase
MLEFVQVEVHPYYQQRDLRAFCAAQGILVQVRLSHIPMAYPLVPEA